MKFTVNSVELRNKLKAIGGVINNKSTLPILNNFEFEVCENELFITASNLEVTLNTSVKITNSNDCAGFFCIDATRITSILNELADQPLKVSVTGRLSVDIVSSKGRFKLAAEIADDYPRPAVLNEEKRAVSIKSKTLHSAINRTIIATATDDLRPVMSGLYIEIKSTKIDFVATDAHKLIKISIDKQECDCIGSFILPKKPAQVLKSLLAKDVGDVIINFDNKNATFETSEFTMNARLTDGNYPKYESVIPENNSKIVSVNRLALISAIKRVSIFTNKDVGLTKLELTNFQFKVSAQDIDYSTFANEIVDCEYQGENIEIGFKASFLIELLSNSETEDVIIKLDDPARAALIIPKSEDNDTLMLIMPMMLTH